MMMFIELFRGVGWILLLHFLFLFDFIIYIDAVFWIHFVFEQDEEKTNYSKQSNDMKFLLFTKILYNWYIPPLGITTYLQYIQLGSVQILKNQQLLSSS